MSCFCFVILNTIYTFVALFRVVFTLSLLNEASKCVQEVCVFPQVEIEFG